jgi:hypothetical protein
MDKKSYIKPYMKVVNIRTCGMLAASGDQVNMKWSGNRPGTAGSDGIDENSTYDSF